MSGLTNSTVNLITLLSDETQELGTLCKDAESSQTFKIFIFNDLDCFTIIRFNKTLVDVRHDNVPALCNLYSIVPE